jgi:hypothetical protein
MTHASISFTFENASTDPQLEIDIFPPEAEVEIVTPGHSSKEYSTDGEYRVRAKAPQGWRPVTTVRLNNNLFSIVRESDVPKGTKVYVKSLATEYLPPVSSSYHHLSTTSIDFFPLTVI